MGFNILIGADLVPTKSNYFLFQQANLGELIGEEIENILKSSDFSIFNLEVPLINEAHPIKKCGPNLIAPTSTIVGLKKINPYFFTLANNHILDQGEQGLTSTIKLLDKYGIAYAGVGKNSSEARKPYILTKEGKKIGIYCCAEHEFSIATDKTPGANLFDPLESLDDINELKAKSDFVIVLYHGGKEHYRYPSPYLQRVCRKIIDKGADLVICQHSHCIGCKEDWNNGTIIYGQGNFLFDDCENEFWQTSLLIKLTISHGNNKPIINFIPLKKENNKVRLANNLEKKRILEDFKRRTDEIKIDGCIEEKYRLFAEQMQMSYLHNFAGLVTNNIIYRIINKLSGHRFQKYFLKMLFNKKVQLAMENYIECEAHRELLLHGLKNNKI